MNETMDSKALVVEGWAGGGGVGASTPSAPSSSTQYHLHHHHHHQHHNHHNSSSSGSQQQQQQQQQHSLEPSSSTSPSSSSSAFSDLLLAKMARMPIPSPVPSPLLGQRIGGVILLHHQHHHPPKVEESQDMLALQQHHQTAEGQVVPSDSTPGPKENKGPHLSSVMVHMNNQGEEVLQQSQKNSTSKLPMEAEEDSGSDAEVSQIEFTVHVNLRNKKKRGDGAEEQERPMSWEGELSDGELSQMNDAVHNSATLPCKQEPEEISMEGIQTTNPGSPASQLKCVEEQAADGHKSTCESDWARSIGVVGEEKPSHPLFRAQPPPPSSNLPPPLLPDYHLDLPLPLTERILGTSCYTPSQSPLQPRHPKPQAPTPSPDSAIHSAYYSPTQSPVQSRHLSGFSSPFSHSHRTTPSLSRNNSDASQYGGSQHSYSSSTTSPISPTHFSPTHSPVQSRHHLSNGAAAANNAYSSPLLNRAAEMANFSRPAQASDLPSSPLTARHGGGMYPGSLHRMPEEHVYAGDGSGASDAADELAREGMGGLPDEKLSSLPPDLMQHSALAAQAGISRQQLINSPCPICGDKISGFHYGIFSCESCKGFFKRTVQNRKNYVCLRGSTCPVAIATRKKCPACRFEKCLKMGMKLEAIREDRTRGGRSTYQCSYTLPASLAPPAGGGDAMGKPNSGAASCFSPGAGELPVKLEAGEGPSPGTSDDRHQPLPRLLQDIMDVEHLWHYNDQEIQKMTAQPEIPKVAETNSDYLSNLCNVADHRLYKIVKWCKSLPLFKNIQIDDQTSLLINAWCELLLFSCCFRSMGSPGEIRVSLGKSLSLEQSRSLGLGPCIERMLNFTEHLRRLKVDKYEYVAMKVIVLLASDASGLKEPEKVRCSQEKVLQALQQYTLSHYPELPSKFGELLLRIPDLQRTCQVGKEMLSIKNKEGEVSSFNLLMELLRGDH